MNSGGGTLSNINFIKKVLGSNGFTMRKCPQSIHPKIIKKVLPFFLRHTSKHDSNHKRPTTHTHNKYPLRHQSTRGAQTQRSHKEQPASAHSKRCGSFSPPRASQPSKAIVISFCSFGGEENQGVFALSFLFASQFTWNTFLMIFGPSPGNLVFRDLTE